MEYLKHLIFRNGGSTSVVLSFMIWMSPKNTWNFCRHILEDAMFRAQGSLVHLENSKFLEVKHMCLFMKLEYCFFLSLSMYDVPPYMLRSLLLRHSQWFFWYIINLVDRLLIHRSRKLTPYHNSWVIPLNLLCLLTDQLISNFPCVLWS